MILKNDEDRRLTEKRPEAGKLRGKAVKLADLAAYADRKFHIKEQHKWAGFRGFSVLADPRTGKWLALLMRRRDKNTGRIVETADLKCGQDILSENQEYFLSPPFRMKGRNWVGVNFSDETNDRLVYRLFDRAVGSENRGGCTIVLENQPAAERTVPAPNSQPYAERKENNGQKEDQTAWSETRIRGRIVIPDRIRQMYRLYQPGKRSLKTKSRNFYRQGKFMEDYEDNFPWEGEFNHYFPTYHDLDPAQLRGYFSWRTRVRKGDCQKISPSFAYIYVYELLNGIGTASALESLRKLDEFSRECHKMGPDYEDLEKNIRRWMVQMAVMNNIDPEIVRRYADQAILKRDRDLLILREPEKHSDEEIFSALSAMTSRKLSTSSAVKKYPEESAHIFAEVWKKASAGYKEAGRELFRECFGSCSELLWYPLGNAIYYQQAPLNEIKYQLDPVRYFRCDGIKWYQYSYNELYFNRKLLNSLIRGTDRLLRISLKTGHPLKEKEDEEWAEPYIRRTVEEYRKEREEAARPKIRIDFSDLGRIRSDAAVTENSLLTDEERGDEGDLAESRSFSAGCKGQESETKPAGSGWPDSVPSSEQSEGQKPEAEETAPFEPAAETVDGGNGGDSSEAGILSTLDDLQAEVLKKLLAGEPVAEMIRAAHGMPEMIADGINEAFFDEIGDSVVECEEDSISLVEDYRDDIRELVGEDPGQ